MRIVGGKFKGTRFKAPKTNARPTTDFAKEALFNILHHQLDFEDLIVLDLFSGIGSISLEFASRGSEDIWCVEKERRQTKFIEEMACKLEISKNLRVVNADVFKFMNTCAKKFNLIFADPPYHHDKMDLVPTLIFEKNLLMEGGRLILEHDKKTDFSAHPHFVENRKYGNVHFSFFE